VVRELWPGRFELHGPLVVRGEAQLQVQFMVVSHLGLPMDLSPELQKLLEDHLEVSLAQQGQEQQQGVCACWLAL
jgi:hypothetical protein